MCIHLPNKTCSLLKQNWNNQKQRKSLKWGTHLARMERDLALFSQFHWWYLPILFLASFPPTFIFGSQIKTSLANRITAPRGVFPQFSAVPLFLSHTRRKENCAYNFQIKVLRSCSRVKASQSNSTSIFLNNVADTRLAYQSLLLLPVCLWRRQRIQTIPSSLLTRVLSYDLESTCSRLKFGAKQGETVQQQNSILCLRGAWRLDSDALVYLTPIVLVIFAGNANSNFKNRMDEQVRKENFWLKEPLRGFKSHFWYSIL